MIQPSMRKEIDSMRREMENAFDKFARTPGRAPMSRWFANPAWSNPSLRLWDDETAIYIEAVIPGVEPASLDVSVERNVLTLSGEKPRLSGDHDAETFHRKERATGHFTRRINLPVEVDADAISAAYTNGILKVTLPKAEQAKPKRITIQAA